MTNGEWRLLSSVRTSDGGKVTLRTDITNLKKAERALLEGERRFRSVVEDHPLPVSLIDVETGKILYESPAAAALMGREWPPGEDHTVHARYVDPDRRKAYIQRLRRDGEVRDFELEVKRLNGTRFWISLNSRLVLHEGREVAVTSHIDLTERKQREAELRHVRETLEDAIESLYEGFALYDTQDRLVMCNERFRELSQPTADILKPGLKWIDFARISTERGQYPDAIGREEAWVKDWAAGRAKLPMSREFRQSDGTWIVSSAQRTRHGGVVVTRSDITQRKEMERVRREAEEQIRSVVEACPTPVVMTRVEDGEVIYASPALEELFGKRPPTAKYSGRDFFVDPKDRDRYVAALRERGVLDGFEVKLKRLTAASSGAPCPRD